MSFNSRRTKAHKEVRNLVMLPNGKQPLKAYGGPWKPSDGYTEPKTSLYLQRGLAVLFLLALAGILVLASTR